MEMGVRLQVWAIAGGTSFKIDGPDEVALDQRLEAIVDRRQRYHRHLRLGAREDVFRGGMVTSFEENAVNHLALGGGAQPAVGEALGEGP